MSIKILPRAGVQVSGATAVEIDHANDSISLGDGTNLIEFLEASPGVWAIPVQPIGGGDASASNQTSGAQKSQIWDPVEAASAEIDDVGGEKALKVSVIASVGGGGGGTAATDEASFTSGASQFTGIGGQYDANESETLTDGQMGMVGMTSTRHLKVAVQNNITGFATDAKLDTIIGHIDGLEGFVDGLEGQLTTLAGYLDGVETTLSAIETAVEGTLTVGTHAVTQSGTWNIGSITTLPSLPAGSNNIGDVDIASALPAGDNNIGNVDIVTMPTVTVNTHAVTQSGTWNIGSITTLPSISLAASSNNIGDVDVLSLPALPAGNNNIGDVDVASLPALPAGTNNIGVVTPVVVRGSAGRQGTTISASTSETTIVTATASVYHDLTLLMITNTSDTKVRVDIREDTGASVLFSVAIAANGGAVIPFPVPLSQTAVNDNWTAQCSASVTDIRIFACFATRS